MDFVFGPPAGSTISAGRAARVQAAQRVQRQGQCLGNMKHGDVPTCTNSISTLGGLA